MAIQDDEVGRAVTLAGDDRQCRRLDREIGDEWIADHDRRGPLGQLHDPGLVEEDDDRVSRGAGASKSHQQEDGRRPVQRPQACPPRAHNAIIVTLRNATRIQTTEEGCTSWFLFQRKMVKEVQTSRARSAPAKPSHCEALACVNGCTSCAPKLVGNSRVGDPVIVGQFAGRHVERAEQQVENRKGRGKIFFAAADRPQCDASGGTPEWRSRI